MFNREKNERKTEIVTNSLFDETIAREPERIFSALNWADTSYIFDNTRLNEDILKKIAQMTNSATIHYSGNCVLLSNIMLYNLKISKVELTGGNTHPFYEPIDELAAHVIIFGSALNLLARKEQSDIETLAVDILDSFKKTGERFFYVGLSWKATIGASGHSLNAVVLGSDDTTRVVFVDAWKTSTPIYSVEALAKRYNHKLTFALEAYRGPIVPLPNPSLKKTILKP